MKREGLGTADVLKGLRKEGSGALGGRGGSGSGGGGGLRREGSLNKAHLLDLDKSPATGSVGKSGSKSLSSGMNVLKRPLADVREKYAVNSSDELGRGQFGVIRVCVRRATGERMACKSISKSRLARWQDVEDVRTEVAVMELMAGKSSVVQIRDAFEDANHVHLVMELCEGGELFDRIKAKRRFSEGKAATILRTVVGVLKTCHAMGIMHRDLKPENILLMTKDSDTNVKVIDWGVATFFKPSTPLTECVGTPNYVAPEVLEGRYGPEGDIWSAGVVLFILLSGGPPFWAINQNDGTLELMKSRQLELTGGLWDSISLPAKNLVRRMLTLDPHQRIKPEEILAHPWLMC